MPARHTSDTGAAGRLGAALRALQQRSGCTLRDLEDRLNVSDSSLSRYFRGSTVPPWPVVRDLCHALDADPDAYRVLWEAADRNQPRPSLPADQLADQPADRPADRPTDRPSDRSTVLEDSPGDGPGDAPADGSEGLPGVGRPRLPELLKLLARLRRPGRVGSLLTGLLVGAVLGTFGTLLVVRPAPAAEATREVAASGGGGSPSDSVRIFVSRATGGCLDHSLDQRLRSYACNGMSYQRWTVTRLTDGTHRLRNHATGACLEHGEPAGLRATTCSASSASQQWRVTPGPDDAVQVRNGTTGACLDDSALAGLRALPCADTDRQRWG
ncbi:helix-turn-helix domain-containing protein [Streptomyces sp. NPDC047974]|uniref:helix-turn-helix domain-containing protein n=1 Tax=Streptomyces sp. NPDC047974 TaxID=3154343 RepID=UPI0033DCECC7